MGPTRSRTRLQFWENVPLMTTGNLAQSNQLATYYSESDQVGWGGGYHGVTYIVKKILG